MIIWLLFITIQHGSMRKIDVAELNKTYKIDGQWAYIFH